MANSENQGEVSKSFKLYLEEIGHFSLITVEEEKILGHRIRKGDEEAVEALVKANLRLVIHIARHYERYGTLADIISEGNIGLMKAARKFNPAFGAKFSTYASWWIKQYIQRYVNQSAGAMRVPHHAWDKVRKIRNYVESQVHLGLGEPSDEEIAEAIKMPIGKVSYYRSIVGNAASIDAPVGDEDSSSLGNILKDELAVDPGDSAVSVEDSKILNEVIAQLDDKEKDIIVRRFGLNGNKHETLEQVSRTYGVTRERIRQIEAIILKKLSRLGRTLKRN